MTVGAGWTGVTAAGVGTGVATGATAVAAGAASDHHYGTFAMTSGGVWTYTLDNSNADVQARNVGDQLRDTFTVTTIDGTAQLITVTIDGANDAAVISGTVPES